jgi:pimeloyl-ACP methyl ester carboxylesterase
MLFRALRSFPRIHLSFLASGLAPLLARIRLPGDGLFLNRRNVEVRPVERALCYLVADLYEGEVSQFLDWMESREFRTFDRAHSYDQNLGSVAQPLFFIAGAKDYLVPPASVATIYDRIASTRKAFSVLGREHGQEEDYGHGDLLIGKNVRHEVFPLILEWLLSIERTSAGTTQCMHS